MVPQEQDSASIGLCLEEIDYKWTKQIIQRKPNEITESQADRLVALSKFCRDEFTIHHYRRSDGKCPRISFDEKRRATAYNR